MHDDSIKRHKKRNITKKTIETILILIPLMIVLVFFGTRIWQKEVSSVETVTVSTLEKIIDISEFSTFQAVYNGIAEVRNTKKTEQIDYYVSYKSKVNAGFDFKEVEIKLDQELKIIRLLIPEISIQSIEVDITSMDYIFQNEKANTSTVSATAYNACREDAENESKKQSEIYELAKDNAENIMKALATPFIEQMDEEYKLIVVFGGV